MIFSCRFEIVPEIPAKATDFWLEFAFGQLLSQYLKLRLLICSIMSASNIFTFQSKIYTLLHLLAQNQCSRQFTCIKDKMTMSANVIFSVPTTPSVFKSLILIVTVLANLNAEDMMTLIPMGRFLLKRLWYNLIESTLRRLCILGFSFLLRMILKRIEMDLRPSNFNWSLDFQDSKRLIGQDFEIQNSIGSK